MEGREQTPEEIASLVDREVNTTMIESVKAGLLDILVPPRLQGGSGTIPFLASCCRAGSWQNSPAPIWDSHTRPWVTVAGAIAGASWS
jgi:hypothetical protein